MNLRPKNRAEFWFYSCVPALLALSLVLPMACAQTPQTSATKPNFSSEKHQFSLWLPTPPQTHKRKLLSQDKEPTEIFGVRAQMPNQAVGYFIVPTILPEGEAKMARDEYFDLTQQGVVEASGGEVLSSSNIEVNDQTVRVLTYSFSRPTATSAKPIDFFGETRIYKLGARTYQFTALVPKGQLAASRAQIAKVLGSVTIAK